ncbi:MAG: GAF domain-containing protein [Solirubrobacterales bacterium]|nr:GAF domain-containing protein [Solirubrobacterales bacterium]MBV9366846.1 GAF domain-containing protein [Solirubrobacterales bacterium]MBV9680286.1 GAF domain-containing protein [Solirubrobacterales bacterium]MBV9808655.1 GAF domain-containing protein [Solirubrobacterales bacterium]
MTAVERSEVGVDALELFVEVLSQDDGSPAGDVFYDRLCEAVCRLAHMRRALIFRYDPARRRVRAAGAHGLSVEPFADAHVTVESAPIAAQSLREDRVIEIAGDMSGHVPEEYAGLFPEPVRLVCAPMAAAGRALGVIFADRLLPEPPLDEAERHLLWTLGKAAALASVARMVATQGEKARQLEQRIDLAREIHEGVIQRLFGISMALDGEGDLPAQARGRCATEIQEALSDLRTALQRPLGRAPRATRTTFVAEVERLARAHPDLGVTLEAGEEGDVPPALQPLAQSVLAEAVRNAHKHARPNRVSVRVGRSDGAFVLEVANDGVSGTLHRTGMGLRLAALEALHSGGVVEFGEREPGTWKVRLVVPVEH